MSLSFKLSFDQNDFFDKDFLHDLKRINNFYDNAIYLEYKANKEKINESYESLEEIIETINGETFISPKDVVFSICYNNIIPINSKNIKIIYNKIDNLETIIETQKNKITNLENENKILKEQINNILERLSNLEN